MDAAIYNLVLTPALRQLLGKQATAAVSKTQRNCGGNSLPESEGLASNPVESTKAVLLISPRLYCSQITVEPRHDFFDHVLKIRGLVPAVKDHMTLVPRRRAQEPKKRLLIRLKRDNIIVAARNQQGWDMVPRKVMHGIDFRQRNIW